MSFLLPALFLTGHALVAPENILFHGRIHRVAWGVPDFLLALSVVFTCFPKPQSLLTYSAKLAAPGAVGRSLAQTLSCCVGLHRFPKAMVWQGKDANLMYQWWMLVLQRDLSVSGCSVQQNRHRICSLLTWSSQFFMLPLLSCRAGWLTRQSYCYPKDKWEGICAAPLTMNRNAFCKMLLSALHPCTYSVSRTAEIPGFEWNRCKKLPGTAQVAEYPLIWGWRSSKFGSVFLGASLAGWV